MTLTADPVKLKIAVDARVLKHGCMQWERDSEEPDTQAMARIIFDAALLESGYMLPSPKDFNQRIYDLLARSHNIKSDLSQAPAGFDDAVCHLTASLNLQNDSHYNR